MAKKTLRCKEDGEYVRLVLEVPETWKKELRILTIEADMPCMRDYVVQAVNEKAEREVFNIMEKSLKD